MLSWVWVFQTTNIRPNSMADRDRDREPTSSSLHNEAIEIESEVNNNATIPIVIGELSSQDYDFQESVIWTHNYFRKCEDSEHAICLTCEAENLTRGPKQVKKKESIVPLDGALEVDSTICHETMWGFQTT